MSLLNKKSLCVLFLERNSFTFFNEKGQSIVFPFPPGSANELDIINEELLTKGLSTFILSKKITPATIMIILSTDITYEKQFLDPVPVSQPTSADVTNGKKNEEQKPPESKALPAPIESRTVILEERARQIQLFLDTVPFEDIASKNYKHPKGVRVIATNKRFYETLITVLAKQMFIVDAVVPFIILDKEFTATPGMNADKAKKLIKKYEIIKHMSLLEENRLTFDHNADAHHIQMTTKITTKREIGLVGVFGCLLLILGIMSYTTFFAPAHNRKVASLQQVAPPPEPIIPTVELIPTPIASESAIFDKETIKILINGGTGVQQKVIKDDLVASGFKDITTNPSSTPARGKARIIFSQTLTSEQKEVLLEEIKKTMVEISVQESDTSDADVTINL